MKALGLVAAPLCAALAGCGLPDQEPAAPGAVPYTHGQSIVAQPALSLPDWTYVPDGRGVSSSAGSVGARDSQVNYMLALRTASLKLTGDLPALADMRAMEAAIAANKNDGGDLDPQARYVKFVRAFVADKPRFGRQMIGFWRNTLRMGGTLRALSGDSNTTMADVNLETAPTFAARLTSEGADLTRLFTQDKETCPTFNGTTGDFTAGSCATESGMAEGAHAGVLTNPGFLAQYYSNMAFRRVRLIQELFVCRKFPTEFVKNPEQVNGYLYTSPWPRTSITTADAPPVYKAPRKVRGGGTSTISTTAPLYVDFTATCAGCHTTINHIAPLFLNFDAVGKLQANSMVQVPVGDAPFAQMADFLPEAEYSKLAWRMGQPAATIKDLGKAMAADPQVAQCLVTRAWNFAMSRADVVEDAAIVPESVVAELTGKFKGEDKFNYKETLVRIFTHPAFIRY